MQSRLEPDLVCGRVSITMELFPLPEDSHDRHQICGFNSKEMNELPLPLFHDGPSFSGHPDIVDASYS